MDLPNFPMDDQAPVPVLSIDTTKASPLHRLVRAGINSTGALRAYVYAVTATYLPLFVAALFGRNPLIASSATVKLTFLHDYNIALMFLVTFPTLIAVIVTDQSALSSALKRIQLDGIVTLSASDASTIADRWQRRFRKVNIASYLVGAIVGVVVAIFNYKAYISPSVGYWIARGNSLEPVGYVFLYGMFVFYGVIPLCVFRNLATSFLLRDIVANTPLRMLPFHPDRSGGLRPVGRLGLRNQYVLTVCGLNLVTLIIISIRYLNIPTSLYGLIVAAAFAYVILGPVVFMGPLLSFRRGMLNTKATLLSEVAVRLRIELHRLRGELANGKLTKKDEQLIDRLRKVGAVIDELPIWPFDASTLRRFLTAYVIPLIGALAYAIIPALLSFFATHLIGHRP